MPLCSQSTLFVDVSGQGNGDGSNWANAIGGINNAVIYASPGDTILIKEGEYKEFVWIDKSIHLFGGFDGSEMYSSEANIANNGTILNGDYNGDDIPATTSNKSDNFSYLIAVGGVISADIKISGITFKNAYNNNAFNSGRGSAIIVRDGGGNSTNPGAINCYIQKCKFVENYALAEGGAIYSGSTSNYNQVITYVDKCTFATNSSISSRGAAIFNYAYGGSYSYAGISVINSVFVNNTDPSTDFPAVIYNASSSNPGIALATVINSTFYNNGGGAALIWHGGSGANTIATLTFKNNIVWNSNTNYASIYIGNSATAGNQYQVLIEKNCLITNPQNNVNSGVTLNSNISSNPLFVSSSDYNLQPGSPCINTGDTLQISQAYWDDIDYSGNTRFSGDVDLGAIETSETSGISKTDLKSNVLVYPNPSSDFVYVNLEHEDEVQLLGMDGKLFFTSEKNRKHSFSVSSLENGVYIIRCQGNSTLFIKK